MGLAVSESPITTSRFTSRRIALAVLIKAFPGWNALLFGLGAVLGTLPVLFALATLVSSVPAATRHGFSSPAGHRLFWPLLAMGAITLAQEFAP